MSFITPALAAGEPVVAAIPPARGELLRRALNGYAARLRSSTCSSWGAIQPESSPRSSGCWSSTRERPSTTSGSRFGPGARPRRSRRRPGTRRSINLAWPGAPIRVLCPYDADGLSPEILADAERTHPTVIEHGGSRGGARPTREPRSRWAPTAAARRRPARRASSRSARGAARRSGISWPRRPAAAGLGRERVEDLMLAVSEMAPTRSAWPGRRRPPRVDATGPARLPGRRRRAHPGPPGRAATADARRRRAGSGCGRSTSSVTWSRFARARPAPPSASTPGSADGRQLVFTFPARG